MERPAAGDDNTPLVARAPSVIVIKVSREAGPEAIRIHTHEHLAQIERTLAAHAAAG